MLNSTEISKRLGFFTSAAGQEPPMPAPPDLTAPPDPLAPPVPGADPAAMPPGFDPNLSPEERVSNALVQAIGEDDLEDEDLPPLRQELPV